MSTRLDLDQGRVEMAHGGGGRAMSRLIQAVFTAAFDHAALAAGEDAARVAAPAGQLAVATDSHVVTPLFFPGGDIGSLAVHGTVNDLAMAGARPLYLTAGFVLEEGFPLADLKRIAEAMAAASSAAGVPVIAGDTKVVERGNADGVYINTTGIGAIPSGVELGGDRIRAGDRIVINGTVGDHGVAILSEREGMGFSTELVSDSTALHGLVQQMLAAAPGLRCLRDPTRGGLAAALNELATQAGVGMQLREADLPVQEAVRGACEVLGLDPLHLANEGKVVAICPPDETDALLEAMRSHSLGAYAAEIGTVINDERCLVEATTAFGGSRLVEWLYGEQLPRIC